MIIETQRLVLRAAAESDISAWSDFRGDPAATQHLHSPEPERDPHQLVASLRRWVALYEDPIGLYALDVQASGETAGFVGFIWRELPWGEELEIGWLMRRRFWGLGFATEAARALRPLVPGRVVSIIRTDNEPSANVARKLGMTIECTIDHRGFATDVWASPHP